MRLLTIMVMMFYLCSCTTIYRTSQCQNENYYADNKNSCDVVAEHQIANIDGVPWPVWVFMLPLAIIISLTYAHDHGLLPAFDPNPIPPLHPGR